MAARPLGALPGDVANGPSTSRQASPSAWSAIDIWSLSTDVSAPAAPARDRRARAPVGVVAQHLDRHVGAHEACLHVRVIECRRTVAQVPGRVGREPVQQHAQLHLVAQHDWPALVRRMCIASPPAALLAEQVLARDDDAVEEDLAELRVAGHLHERAHLDPGGAHVDDQVGDAAVRRRVGIRAREHGTSSRTAPMTSTSSGR